MAAIYLIRHGQASFGKANYDQLSDLGAKQSYKLGEHWQQLTKPDKLYSGELLRHRQTAENFLTGYGGNELLINDHAGFNEFNHIDILQCYQPLWKNPTDIADFINKPENSDKLFRHEFTRAMDRWISGEYDEEYKESFIGFKRRCVLALQEVIANSLESSNSMKKQPLDNIMIFTSGGAISAICQHILMTDDDQMLKMNQQMLNTSITKLQFSDTHLSLDYLNNYTHLELAGSNWVTLL